MISPPPDLDLARRFLRAHGPDNPLLCAITGSHIYGFPSPNSDLDIKGIHQAPTAALLGLENVTEGVDRIADFEQVECDLTSNEVRQALRLVLQGNGNMLERIFSPLQLIDSAEAGALKRLAQGALSKRFVRHYGGFFKGCCRDHERAAEPYAKSMLYTYRVALTGVHLLKAGEVECDLERLTELYGFPEARDLMALKMEREEKAVIDGDLDARHRKNWPALVTLLNEAHASSALPEAPENQAECAAWLISIRRQDLLNSGMGAFH